MNGGKIRWTRYFGAVAIFCGFLVLILAPFGIREMSRNAAEQYEGRLEVIDIEFAGRVYPDSEIQPGTFAIIRPWSEVKNWKEESLLSYKISSVENAIMLTAWTPNADISGTWLKSETSIPYNFVGPVAAKKFFSIDGEKKQITIREGGINRFTLNANTVIHFFLLATILVGLSMFKILNYVWAAVGIMFHPCRSANPISWYV